MKKYLQHKFALTEQGAEGLIRASIACFFGYLLNMIPAMILMFFLQGLLFTGLRGSAFYLLLSVLILFLMAFQLGLEYDSLYNETYRESANLRIEIAKRLTKLPLSYFSKHDLSDLSQTIMSDVTAIEHAMSHAMARTIGFFLFFPLISVLLLAGDFRLGLAVIIPVLADLLLIRLSRGIQVSGARKYYEQLRENSEKFQETIEMQQELRSLGLSLEKRAELYRTMEESERLHIRTELMQAVPVTLAGLLMQLALPAVILTGTALYLSGEISILYLIGYILAAMKIKEGMDGLSMFSAELFYLNARVQRINAIRQTKLQGGEEHELKSCTIDLEKVAFSYNDETPVLRSVSFSARQGEVTALVGRSGCGKTSILRVVSRLYDYEKGSIRIDGRDIREISTDSLFRKVSIVFQDVTLFNSSVLENIRIGRKDASDEEVMEAARLANCTDFIERLPDGIHSIIGENGASLSGGERQRISIARAFLKNAPILILDEIAASLDVENEEKIQESLNSLIRGRTVLIISHRLKSVENVDKIVVIEEGRTEAEGSHGELLKSSVSYQRLVENAALAESFRY